MTFSNIEITGVKVMPGEEFFIRWLDLNDAGNDHAVAIDDLTVSYTRVFSPVTGPVIQTDPQSGTVNVATSTSLSVTLASGTPPFTYQWYKDNQLIGNGGNFSGTTNSMITFTNIMHTNAGAYKVVIGNSASSANVVTSAVANLTVQGFAITPIAMAHTTTNVPVIVGFSFIDNQTPITSASGTSGNAAVLTDGNIVVSPSGNSRTATLAPQPSARGVSVVTLTCSDGSFTTNVTFPLMVVPFPTVVFNDFFDYADGSLVPSTGGLWQNHGGTAGDLQEVSGFAYLSRVATEDVNAKLIGQPYSTNNPGELYSKFTVSFSSTETPTANGSYFAHFKDDAFGFRARVWVYTNASGIVRLGIGNGSEATNSPGFSNLGLFPRDLAYNTTYTIITRLVLSNGVSTIWVDPTSKADTSVTATDGVAVSNAVNIVSYALRQNSGMSKLFFDNLVVGTSYDAVTGVAPPPSAPALGIAPSGANVALSWTDAAYHLEYASDIRGPWTPICGSASPYNYSITGTQLFFHLSNATCP
ncbi:MAG: immunoglobulin domain-containing protein [Verrucomicrobia bacterium]|nr:immunoglobulin domain-containing protein [Verrucomicrobiota bacterium]